MLGKKPALTLIVSALVLLLAAGCVSPSEAAQTQAEVTSLQTTIASLQQQIDASSETIARLSAATKANFDQSIGRVQAIETAVATLQAQAEATHSEAIALQSQTHAIQTQAGKLQEEVSVAEERMARLAEDMSRVSAQTQDTSTSLDALENTYTLRADKLEAQIVGLAAVVQERDPLARVPSLLVLLFISESETSAKAVTALISEAVHSSGDELLINAWEDSAFDPRYGPEDYVAFDTFVYILTQHLAKA
ncbi:MAG: hypothetical protein HY685_05445 [Chloroflexi bacterium]|nr:hypothetical protein [Chloroflexota bacterium]MBI4329289.1 hypothetical protein [Chloroflexota bacterium]